MSGAEANHRVQRAFEECRRITRRHARNFYYGLKLAPEPKRSALFVLYAWMRRADDIVDDGHEAGAAEIRRRLKQFGDATDQALRRALTSRDRQDEEASLENDDAWLWPAVHEVGLRFNLAPRAFHEMIEGQLEDVAPTSYATFDELRDYCYRVASTVGLLCIRIFGYDDAHAEELAIDRGIAFQLTNILRDFGEDFERGRVYLPAEDFARHGLSPEDVRRWTDDARCSRFFEEQIERARSFYERSSSLDAMIESDCRPVLWAMTTIYASLLDRIAEQPRRAATGSRIGLSPLRKGIIALEARRRHRHSISRAVKQGTSP